MSIKNEQEYTAAIEQVKVYFVTEPVPGSDEAARFVQLLKDIENYEEENFPAKNDPVVVFEIHGIKCDTPGCDFVDETVSWTDYAEWVNRPCPKCSANLLTEADYDMVVRMKTYADTINELASFGGVGLKPVGDTEIESVELTFDGSGVPKIAPR